MLILILISRSLVDLKETAQTCHQINPKCELILCDLDVCDSEAMEKAVQKCKDTFGKITIVVHNVGLHGVHSAVG